MAVSVGIDLGTTYCAVAYVEPKSKKVQVIQNSEGKKLTPSVIQFYDGEVIFGSEAQEAYIAGEDNCIATFKREMGTDRPFCYVEGRPYTSEELSSMLLRHLKEDAERMLGEEIADAVITVPAYFYSKEREATLRAAKSAGLRVKKLIDEPNAAAMAYGLNHWRENANILVYDLGGGTFDVTLVHMGKNGELRAISTKGDHKLGGRDWDARLQTLLVSRFEEETELAIEQDPMLLAVVNGMAEGVKKQLCAPNMESIKVAVSFPGYGRAVVSVTRAEFEAHSADLLDRTGALCLEMLKEVGFTTQDVTDVLLVGGSTRMPRVFQYLHRLFKKRPLTHVNPDEAVVLGAAIQAQQQEQSYAELSVEVIDGKKTTDYSKSALGSRFATMPEKKLSSLEQLSLRETTAHAMGVIAICDEGTRYYNEIIIPANHPRPVRAAKRFRFFTSAHEENELALYVLQGDRENPLECQITYKYVVTGIRHVLKGEKYGSVVRVQYSYDTNGIIRIQARQEDDEMDLPIHREKLPHDLSKFGRPVVTHEGEIERGLQMSGNLAVRNHQNFAHRYRSITFSNVEWQHYDNIRVHPAALQFNEPERHVIADEQNIEFHGYNISEMDEGVFYCIMPEDDFEISCNIDTSRIKPHPGGYLEISLGLIKAKLNEHGGKIYLNKVSVATVPSRFHLRMSFTNRGNYEVEINGEIVGKERVDMKEELKICFGFVHDSHCCHLLSHAYIRDIEMLQGSFDEEENGSDAPTWED